MNKHKYIFGVFLIVFGIVLLLGSFGFMNLSFGDLIGTWWPLVIVFIGVKKIIENNRSIESGSITLLIGILLQANQLDMLPMGFWSTFWPLLLILVGVLTIIKKNKNYGKILDSDKQTSYSEDFIEVNAIFSGVDRIVVSRNFQGGNVSSIFSGVKLDLREAVIKDDFKELNIDVVFAGAEILIPFNWQVDAKGTPVFGGFEDKTRFSNNEIEKRIVTINYNITFGGLIIKN